MTTQYQGDGKRQAGGWIDLPKPKRPIDPAGYVPDPDLVAAVNVALTLGQPLLVTGEPGTGKTDLAGAIAHELGFDPPLKYETKSQTESRDLFYTFDTIGRFRAAQSTKDDAEAKRFITYNALGLAILYANDEAAVQDILPPAFAHGGRRRSVVLIDEVDKAPRDVPNDLLNEIDAMAFRIPELGMERLIGADPAFRPVVVFTSNSEKALPDAFLRRCIYYHLPFPDQDRLSDIVANRVGKNQFDEAFLNEALRLFTFLREPGLNLRKRPATAELINWLQYLCSTGDRPTDLAGHPHFKQRTRFMLLKNEDDQRRWPDLYERWQRSQTPSR